MSKRPNVVQRSRVAPECKIWQSAGSGIPELMGGAGRTDIGIRSRKYLSGPLGGEKCCGESFQTSLKAIRGFRDLLARK